MKTTLRQKLEEIDEECRDCPAELAEAALGVIRLKLRDALQDVANLEFYADILDVSKRPVKLIWSQKSSPNYQETYTP